METILTILMFLGIYVVFPLLVATIVCSVALLGKRRATRAARAKALAAREAEELTHETTKV